MKKLKFYVPGGQGRDLLTPRTGHCGRQSGGCGTAPKESITFSWPVPLLTCWPLLKAGKEHGERGGGTGVQGTPCWEWKVEGLVLPLRPPSLLSSLV